MTNADDDRRLDEIEHELRELRSLVGGESALEPPPPSAADLYAIERDKRAGTGKPLLRPRANRKPTAEATNEQIAEARRLLDADTIARRNSGRGGRPRKNP